MTYWPTVLSLKMSIGRVKKDKRATTKVHMQMGWDDLPIKCKLLISYSIGWTTISYRTTTNQ